MMTPTLTGAMTMTGTICWGSSDYESSSYNELTDISDMSDDFDEDEDD